MTSLLRKVIQNQAEQVAKDAGFTTLPVDPFRIARDAGIEVKAKPPSADGVSGMFLKVGDKFGILYATHIHSIGFQNFSVAHELGHYFLEGHAEAVLKMGLHASHAGFVSSDKYEREADQFAAALLMPEDAFRLAMRSIGTGLEAVEKLSDIAKTSLTATAFRSTNSPEKRSRSCSLPVMRWTPVSTPIGSRTSNLPSSRRERRFPTAP
jgi:Zn-dependent peptidase ImmA (M78 family)